jgi:hypothetical protein
MLSEAKKLEQPWNVQNAFQGALPLSSGSEPIAVDSFKCRIPLSMVNIKDQSIKGRWIMVHEDSGLVDDGVARYNSIFREQKGNVNVRWGLETQVTEKGRKQNDYLTIGIPSKLLGSNYFQGITSNNVQQVYRELQGMNVASFTYEDFINKSSCTDIDLKKDFVYEGDFVKAIQEIRELVRPSKERGEGCRTFKERMNQGIEFATRQTTSVKTAPYLKIYAKGVELLSNSKKFVNEFLTSEDLKNIIRMETTIKNKAHLELLYGHRESSVKVLMIMPQIDKERAFEHAIDCHLNPPKARGKSTGDFKPTDWILYNSIKMILQTGADWGKVLESLLQEIDCKVTKARLRKRLNELHTIFLAEGTAPLSPIFSQIFFHNYRKSQRA